MFLSLSGLSCHVSVLCGNKSATDQLQLRLLYRHALIRLLYHQPDFATSVLSSQKLRSGEQILFQFIPAQSVYSLKFSSADRDGTFAFACSIYNRILSPIDRVMSRQVIENSLWIRDFFLEPAFSLARPIFIKLQFVQQFPVLSMDVVDRHTLLHV